VSILVTEIGFVRAYIVRDLAGSTSRNAALGLSPRDKVGDCRLWDINAYGRREVLPRPLVWPPPRARTHHFDCRTLSAEETP